jgi:hypothetical protein
VHDHMEEQVAQLFSQIGVVGPLNCFYSFVALLNKRRPQTFVRLLAIPRAAPGCTKPGDYSPQSGDVAHIMRAKASCGLRETRRPPLRKVARRKLQAQ